MVHHRVVDQHDAQALAAVEVHRLGVGKLHAIERPDEAFHVAGQMQLDFTARFPRIDRATDGMQVGVGQHAPAVVTQADARIVEIGAWHVDVHVHAGAVFGTGVTHDRSEEHTSELQSLMRISYAVFCLKKKQNKNNTYTTPQHK